MDLLLFLISGIIMSCIIEKKYKVATVIHSIVFTAFFVLLLLSSHSDIARFIASYLLSDEIYIFLHDAMNMPVSALWIGYSTYLLVEIVIFAISAALAANFVLKSARSFVFGGNQAIFIGLGKILREVPGREDVNIFTPKRYLVFGRIID